MWERAAVRVTMRCRAIVIRKLFPYYKLFTIPKPLELRVDEREKEGFQTWVRLTSYNKKQGIFPEKKHL